MDTVVKSKCIYDPSLKTDGVRVLVTRYWPRGVRKESVERWMKDLGTEPSLIKVWKSGKIPWDKFRASYKEGLKKGPAKEALEELKALVKSPPEKTVTLLCMCREEASCHRIILKEMLES